MAPKMEDVKASVSNTKESKISDLWKTKIWHEILAPQPRVSRLARKSSMFIPRRSIAESIISILSRGSNIEIEKVKTKRNYLNTYKLFPDTKPCISKIQKVIKTVCQTTCERMEFCDCAESNICTVLNNELHNRIGKLVPKRYRFIIQVQG